MFEDKIEAMNKLPNAVDDSSGFEKRVYTVEEIMDILSIGKNTAYALVNSGVFHFVKVGGHYRISKKSFDRWLDNMDSEMSTYRSKKGLMYNYIIPLIGDVKLDELTPRLMDKFYQSLLKVKTKSVQNKKPKNEYLTVHTVREIHKFLRSAFNQAVKWELMTRNPVLNATLPKEEHQKREIWTAETLMHALEVCDDDILALAINLSFACSLRMGEMLGLTWDCIDISEESLRENNASIYVDKELPIFLCIC